MKLKPHEPGRSTGLLRVASGVAATALIASALGTVAAQADEDGDGAYFGTPEDAGVTKAESDSVIQGDSFTGDPEFQGRYFVELSQPATVEGASTSAVTDEQTAFLRAADSAGLDIDVEQRYGTLWNGLAVNATEADLGTLAELPQVQAIFPVYQVDAPELIEPADAQPDMNSAISQSRADQVHEDLGIYGAGVNIGIIDSGVDIDHPDFGGDGEPGDGLDPDWRHDGLRVEYGYDFVGDDYNADPTSPSFNPVLRSDPNPDDPCSGHGTHVAGIAAGGGDPEAGGIRGVAPEATIGAYRVFGCEGSTTSDVLLAAMEYAYNDGMDVVNMSLGAAFFTWNEYPTALAADALVDAGVVVVNSAGNSGAAGPFAAGAPGTSNRAIGVASFDNTTVTLRSIVISGDEDLDVGYAPGSGGGEIPTEGSLTVSRVGDPGSAEARACAGIPDGADVEGTAVMIERGDCTFYEKAIAGQNAGAAAVIIYDNVAGIINPSVSGQPPVTIPVIAVTQEAGAEIDARVVADPETTLTWTDETVVEESPTAGLMSNFSSYGPEANLDFKPDIGGPGGNILSTYPIEQGSYATASGTSMSAPHVAGTAALLLDYYDTEVGVDLTPDEVREKLQNYAEPALWSGNPASGLLEPVNRQGAGAVDIYAAITNGVAVSPSKIAVNYRDADATESTQTLTLTNETDTEVTYAVDNMVDVIDVEVLTFDWSFWSYTPTIEAPDTVTVPAQGSVEVEVTVVEPEIFPIDDGQGNMIEPENLAYGGYITFTPEGDSEVLRVPYTGFAGDYLDLDILTPGPGDVALPSLARLQPETCERVIGLECVWDGVWTAVTDESAPEESTFTLEDETDVPTLLVQRGHQAEKQEVAIWAVDEAGEPTEEVGVISDLDYVARHAAPTEFDAIVWDGHIDGELAEDGQYAFEVRVLKPLGDEDNPEHWESAVSVPFQLGADPAEYTGPDTVDRLPGDNRYVTAALIAQRFDAETVDTIYLATGMNYPDALAAAARAGAEDSPVLLIPAELPRGGLPVLTQQAITDLDPDNLVIVGGTGAVSEEGELAVEAFAGDTYEVSRVDGEDRYDTAGQLALGAAADYDTVYVATGENFPDALTAASVAGHEGAPVLLSRPDLLPQATIAALTELAPSTIVVVGGDSAINGDVETELGGYADTVERVYGEDRFGTAQALSERLLEVGGVQGGTAYIATGQAFPDALTGAALAGSTGAPLLLVKTETIPNVTAAAIVAFEPDTVVLLGGTAAIGTAVEDALRGAAG